ncbi:40S ribosomal protein S10 [Lingula anatina]|uniref:40S ribosomal protein S10 n=1 Tax=Lingula anatina TaxID=7574 RepID=A0A1S3H9C2_LINAN|nr:40S ribosomal protein S10-like [Lingula anatina]XP_013410046.1 40S ribosomal protein S10 [Lingula anatina]|eukprot:XP_013382071.1 40S ribosomal protein S10-like [Lingula anatina]
MLMPKKARIAVYEHLFKEGVMVARKDFIAPKHPELDNVRNLYVIKAMQSLKSRGYVNEQFAWRHYYWYLTNEGIQYLRDFLHLPPEIVPSTLKRQARPEAARAVRPKGPEGPRSGPGAADRAEYRKAGPPGVDKKSEVGAGADPSFNFRGGFGRGRGAPQQ